jgi:hypothetical protein
MLKPSSEGGVEEMKESEPLTLRNRSSRETSDQESEEERGFHAQMGAFIKAVFGSCGSVLEAATFFVQEHSCRWNNAPVSPTGASPRDAKPALSIVEELQKLAMAEGRDMSAPLPRGRVDIPRFLGEDAVYSFDDDNISAISQHTLEEIASKGIPHPRWRRKKTTKSSEAPPSPIPTTSASSSSSESRRRRESVI